MTTLMSTVRTGALATALAAGVISAPAALSAHAAPAPIACPAALPTAQAVDGLQGTGYTVERGTTPEPFTATVLGRLENGIAPGVDMIMADLSSPALTRAGGVWGGMSGSPVYTADGRLIGAVAYGLAASSPIAGITPAAEMKKLLNLPTAVGQAGKKIAVNRAAAARLAKTGDVTAAEALGGFQRLPVPVTVSGADKGHSAKQAERLQKKLPGTIVRSGAAAPGTNAAPADITAGSNFGAALSYGAATIAGVGTTTFVCDGKAVAFGHPFAFSGAANQFSAHTATALFVQPDPVRGPFKVANFGGVVGTGDQDRLAGIRARLGVAPSTALVRTSFTADGGPRQTLDTRAVAQGFMPLITFNHVVAAVDKGLDSLGQGSAGFTIRVQGTRANGTAFDVQRSDHLASHGAQADLAFELGDYVAAFVDQITSQSFEKVRITGVTVVGTLSSKVSEYRVTSVKVKKGASYVTAKSPITVKAGTTLSTQVALAPYQGNGARKAVTLDLNVIPSTAGAGGALTVATGQGAAVEAPEPTNFTGLLAALVAAPRNDGVAAMLNLERPSGTAVVIRKATRVDAAVAPSEKSFDVVVTR